MKKHIFP